MRTHCQVKEVSGTLVGFSLLGILLFAAPFAVIVPWAAKDRISADLRTSSLPFSHPSGHVSPEVVRGIYLTANTASSKTKREALFDLVDRTELNTVVIDIKDSQGFVAYDTALPFVRENNLLASKPFDAFRITSDAHQRGIWVVARLPVFEDPAVTASRPELALRAANGEVWKTRRGVAWLDSTREEVWAYSAALAKDALRHGFDEVQFDYVRFPSDGALSAIRYANLSNDAIKYPTIAKYFRYLRDAIGQRSYLSVDLFGLTMVKATVPEDDLRIGQRLSDALPVFDAISPMVYPSHYPPTFHGFPNPAEYPGEVVAISLDAASPMLHGSYKKIRPWLQDFDLGAVYTSAMVRAQIDEVEKRGSGGWLLWNPANRYTEEALKSGE